MEQAQLDGQMNVLGARAKSIAGFCYYSDSRALAIGLQWLAMDGVGIRRCRRAEDNGRNYAVDDLEEKAQRTVLGQSKLRDQCPS